MRAERASSTAKMVAIYRALADGGATSVPGFRDPYADKMLSGGFGFALSLIRRRFARMPEDRRAQMIRKYDAVPIRVAVIDAEIAEAVARGCRQVVILGAGFDTRAYRLDALAGTRLFEVDHPATQSDKRRIATTLPPAKTRVIFVPVDFSRDSLAEKLAASGHDPAVPTVWIWEGVVMYLSDDAVRGTLDAIRALSSDGSALILHYHEPSNTALQQSVRKMIFSWIGEPQIGLRKRDAMCALVERAGLAVQADLGIAEQATKVGARAPEGDLAQVSRILVARVG